MMIFSRVCSGLILTFTLLTTYAAPNKTQLAVWVNEAIIATYTYDYENFLDQQKSIAKYFTSDGWIAYSNALNTANLPAIIKKNVYYVSAVATMPPEISLINKDHWKAVMPILVIYKNPQYQQKQWLQITITFNETPSNQGVRGLAINSLNAIVTQAPCKCVP